LFLDEPTIGLDPTTKRILWNLIEELNDDGHTIILCSHDMHEVDMLCDNVGIISTGNLVAYDSPTALKDTLIRQQREEYESLKDTLSTIQEENNSDGLSDETIKEIENREAQKIQQDSLFKFREMSFLVEKLDDDLLKALRKNKYVHDVEVNDSGRIILQIDKFEDKAVRSVLKTLVKNKAKVSSISTEEPSLEDVFMKTTSEAKQGPRA
jgi:ABC-2 type transport system ATP-binding protein